MRGLIACSVFGCAACLLRSGFGSCACLRVLLLSLLLCPMLFLLFSDCLCCFNLFFVVICAGLLCCVLLCVALLCSFLCSLPFTLQGCCWWCYALELVVVCPSSITLMRRFGVSPPVTPVAFWGSSGFPCKWEPLAPGSPSFSSEVPPAPVLKRKVQ